MHYDFEIAGDKKALRTFEGILARAGDPRPAYDRIFGQLERSERKRWETRGFGRWGDDAEGHPINMFRSGTLLASLTARSARGAIRKARGDRLIFGTRIFYAKFHQKGTGVPKRTVTGSTKDDKTFAAREIRDFFLRGHGHST